MHGATIKILNVSVNAAVNCYMSVID